MVNKQTLRKIYLFTHPLFWVEMIPGDPRRNDPGQELFPGRCELSYKWELGLQNKYHQLILDSKEDEGVFFMPTLYQGALELLAMVKERFGKRVVISHEKDWDRSREAIMEGEKSFVTRCPKREVEEYQHRLGSDFSEQLKLDKEVALNDRYGWSQTNYAHPGGVNDHMEWLIWERCKAMAFDFKSQLEDRGYTFDPETVEIVGAGEDWSYCASTYPIGLSRALGLKMPIERRFDLMNPDESPMLLQSTAIEQNIPMPHNIRLYIFRTHGETPDGILAQSHGNYVAQFYEGSHGVMDRPHVVNVDFPQGTVHQVNLTGQPLSFAVGGHSNNLGHQGLSPSTVEYYRLLTDCSKKIGGRQVIMEVGCGGHTPYPASLVMANSETTLGQFRELLVNGRVLELQTNE